MMVPGMSADVSVYKSEMHYRSIRAFVGSTGITPAQIQDYCHRPCLARCMARPRSDPFMCAHFCDLYCSQLKYSGPML
jgi:hypothetical protein